MYDLISGNLVANSGAKTEFSYTSNFSILPSTVGKVIIVLEYLLVISLFGEVFNTFFKDVKSKSKIFF